MGLTAKAAKPKTCKVCRDKFIPSKPMQVVCGWVCGIQHAQQARERSDLRKKQEDARTDRKKREAMKTHPQLIKEAQREFNRFIRARDFNRPCISCGGKLVHCSVGGLVDAGHYRSVGSAPNLRFEEENCHGQCVKCNRYGSGMAIDYRHGLLNRMGSDVVDRLEANNTPRHYTKDELRNIRDTYRIKAREMEKQHGTP